MALADEIQQLANRSLSALDAAHNYYEHNNGVWRQMQESVKDGMQFTIRNTLTGSVVDEQALIALTQLYMTEFHTSFTFQHFVSLLEAWFSDLIRLWLTAYPHSLAKRQIEFSAVLEAPDKSAITFAVVDKELTELTYRRVADWFVYMERLVQLGCPTLDEIERLAEIKVSRDILVHNKGVVNAIYLAKAGAKARYQLGEKLEIPDDYHRASWELMKKVIQDVTAAACRKL